MNTVECREAGRGDAASPVMKTPRADRPLHRLLAVRRLQGVTRRTVARRLKINVAEVKTQESETADLPLSALYQWQEILGVPVNELLVEAGESLSPAVLGRAQMVRLMKTARAMLQHATQVPIRRMIQMMIEQLVDIMPELEEVGPWHSVGQLRSRDEYGRIAERCVSSRVSLERVE